jgi:hypothetical protein
MLEPTADLSRRFYVGPHPLRRYRQRIDSTLSDDEIRQELESQMQPPKLPAAVSIQRGDDEIRTPALLYRLQHNGRVYTAVVVHGTEGPEPVVATVYPTDERLRKVEQADIGPWKDSRHMVRLRYLRTWPFTPAECATILHQPLAVIEQRWDKAGQEDRRCATCVYYGRAMHSCMERDIPVMPSDTACSRYEEDVWEVVRLAARAKIPPEILEQARQMRAQDPPLSWQEIGARLGYPKITLWRHIKEYEGKEVDGEMTERKVTDEILAEVKRTQKPSPEPEPSSPAAICAEPVCETCIHRPVCRYPDVYKQHQEWALCKWWEGAA